MSKLNLPNIKELSNSVDNLTDNISASIESIKNIGAFIDKVSDLCKGAINIISNPIQFIDSIQPYLIIAMMIMIVLKMIGFKPEKWFRLCFIILIFSLLLD